MGHLITARDVLETFNLKEVIFVPANSQPLKKPLLIPPEIRLKLIEVSIKEEGLFSVWDYEIKKGGESYTVETLKAYALKFKEKPFFIMGSDSFKSFHLWKEPEKILTLARLIVVKRAGDKTDLTKQAFKFPTIKWKTVKLGEKVADFEKYNCFFFEGRQIEISSTEIRNRLKEGKSIRYMVTEEAEKVLRRWWKNAFQKDV